MIKSDAVDKVMGAFVKAWASTGDAHKSAKNPFFKSNYADLGAVMDAYKAAFVAEGLALTHIPDVVDGAQAILALVTHSSGQYFGGHYLLNEKDNAQKIGSAYTYARRYTAQGIAHVPSVDDDGQKASTPSKPSASPPPSAQKAPEPPKKSTGYRKSDRTFSAETGDQITEPQYKSLYPLTKSKGWTVEALKGVMQTAFVWFELKEDLKDVHLYDLGKKEYAELRKVLDTK